MFKDDLDYKPQDVCGWNLRAEVLIHGSPCLTQNSLILTKRGYIPMSEVLPGDEVLTKSREWHKVNKKFDNGVHDTVYLQAEGFENIQCTPDHKFYVREMYRQWDNDRRVYVRKWKEPEFKLAKDLTPTYSYLGVPIIKEEIPFTTDRNDFWYFIGMYLGDGWLETSGSGVSLALSEKKIDKLKEICNWNFVYHPNGKDCFRVTIYDTNLKRWIENNIGTGSSKKKISYDILSLPIEQLKYLLKGYLDADGCYVENTKYYQYSSINRSLVYEIGMIVNKVYQVPVNYYFIKTPDTTVIEGRVVNQKDYYQCKFMTGYKKQSHAFYEDGYIWYPVRKIIPGAPEPVYNMEVDTDHSYIVQGCISRNCQDWSIAGKQKGADEGSGTRSSLMWETIQIIKNFGMWKPRVVIWENVKNVLSKHMRHNFEKYLSEMEKLGYVNSYAVLDARDFGLPQKRQRIFTVSILGGPAFDFDKLEKKPMRPLSDFLEDTFEEAHIVKAPSMIASIGKKAKPNFNGVIRVLDGEGAVDTITTAQDRCPNSGVVPIGEDKYRLLTEKECWRLQGFTDEDFEAAKSVTPHRDGYKIGALYKQAGNSMPVPILESLFQVLLKDNMKDYLVTQPSVLGCIGEKGIRRATVITDCANTVTCRQDRTPAQVLDIGYGHYRYLTEKECWRLMGFSDEDIKNAEEVMISKGKMNRELYKQAGNSMPVPVMMALFKELLHDYIENNRIEEPKATGCSA